MGSKRFRCRQCGCRLHDSWWATHQVCETCARSAAPALRNLWYRRIEDAIARMELDGSIAVIANRPTAAQPGSLDRLKAYAARIACGLPLFHPADTVPR